MSILATPCPDHPPGPDGYHERAEWAARMAETHVQTLCPKCGLWAIWEPKPAHRPPAFAGTSCTPRTQGVISILFWPRDSGHADTLDLTREQAEDLCRALVKALARKERL